MDAKTKTRTSIILEEFIIMSNHFMELYEGRGHKKVLFFTAD